MSQISNIAVQRFYSKVIGDDLCNFNLIDAWLKKKILLIIHSHNGHEFRDTFPERGNLFLKDVPPNLRVVKYGANPGDLQN